MAIQVPIVEERQSQGSYQPAQLSRIDQPMPDMSSQINFMGKVNDAISVQVQKATDEADMAMVTDASRQLDDWVAQNVFSASKGALNKKGQDTFGLPDQVINQFDADMKVIVDSLGNERQKNAFIKEMNNRRYSVQQTLYGHERNEIGQFYDAVAVAKSGSAKANAALFYNDPKIIEGSITAAKDALRLRAEAKGVPVNEQELLDVESNTILGVMTRMADNDPQLAIGFFDQQKGRLNVDDYKAAQRLIEPTRNNLAAQKLVNQVVGATIPKSQPNDMADYIMDVIEGGDVVHTDNDGGTVKYGINSKSNPDVDVANLSKDDARQIMLGEYYVAVGADQLPPDMRLVAFDAAVNHGVPKAKQMIEEANGDVRKLLELRKAEYDRLNATGKKMYTKSYDGWMNRLDKVTAQVNAWRNDSNLEEARVKVAQSDDAPEVKKIALSALDDQISSLQSLRSKQEGEASYEAYQYVQNGRSVPPSVAARMNPKELEAMINRSTPDPAFVQRMKGRVLAGDDIDLAQYRWQLGGKYEELVEIQNDPNKRANSRTVKEVIDNNTKLMLGRTTPKTDADFRRVEQFERRVNDEIATLQRQTGKPATADQVQQIADKLLLKMKSGGVMGFFQTETYGFEQPNDQITVVEGIPDDQDYIDRNGKPVTYDVLISSLIAEVQKRGLPVDNKAVLQMFKEQLAKKGVNIVGSN